MIHAVDPHGSFFKFFNRIPFIMQIVLGMILGIILAYLIPQGQSFITMLGDLFVSGLKAIAPLLVFVLVSASIANLSALCFSNGTLCCYCFNHDKNFP